MNDRSEILCSKLYREIKKKLHSLKKNDPQVHIKIDTQEDVYSNVSGEFVDKSCEGKRMIRAIWGIQSPA